MGERETDGIAVIIGDLIYTVTAVGDNAYNGDRSAFREWKQCVKLCLCVVSNQNNAVSDQRFR